MDRLKEDTGRDKLGQVLRDLLNQQKIPFSKAERGQLVGEVPDEVFGLGPIEALLKDPTISDILVNGSDQVHVKRGGLLERSDVKFNDDDHLRRIIDRIVSRVGRRVDEASPMLDARLPDGTRVNVILPPLSLTGPVLSIQRYSGDRLDAAELLKTDTLTHGMLEFLKASVQGKLNILVSGVGGAGKTTLLNVLSAFIPEDELIITIEDSAELSFKQPHVVRLATRPARVEGLGAVRQRQLFVTAMQMWPDRVIVGEIRGDQAFEMLQAMNCGLEGLLATINANSPRQALSRIETMASMGGPNLPEKIIRQQIASAIYLIVQLSRLSDACRKVVSISEVSGLDGTTINIRDLIVFEPRGYGEDRKIRGVFRPTGEKPGFCDKLRAAGIALPDDLFTRMDC